MIPKELDNVDSVILNPKNSWHYSSEYDNQAKQLADKFKDNFKLYGKEVEYLINSGPIV